MAAHHLGLDGQQWIGARIEARHAEIYPELIWGTATAVVSIQADPESSRGRTAQRARVQTQTLTHKWAQHAGGPELRTHETQQQELDPLEMLPLQTSLLV